jgi:DHA2 family multidrug resistance protein-like MFS transporter
MSPLEAGLWMIPATAGIIAGSLLVPVLVRRIPAAHVVSGGLAVAAVGLVVLAQVGSEPNLALVIGGLTVLGIGAAPASTLSVDLIVGSAPPERAGSASAVSETGNELGNALGIALLGSIGVAVYRGAMADGLPAGAAAQLPPEDAAAAGDTLAGAYDAAAGLPASAGAELVAAATAAFVDGMQLAAWTGAALAVAAAIAAPRLLGHPAR